MFEKDTQKERDVGPIIRYLTNTFNQATANMERPARHKLTGPNQLYIMQTEFAYLLNEVVQGPKCVMQKNITACNEYIDRTIQLQSRS